MQALISIILDSINEVLTTAVVIVAFSMLLYNLTRNLRNRVARNSAAVLACVTGVYICDVLVVLEPSVGTIINLLRIQWIGIAFLPSAMFHLSDALLETTGLPSRGRRRRVTRIMYLISAGFTLLAAFTDTLIIPPVDGTRFGNVQAGIAWPVYLAFFTVGIVSAFINVNRARQRCLTRDTRRRMGYLQIAMLTAPGGTFPFAVLLEIGDLNSVGTLLLVNASNLVIILMLLFLSYPLSFFGSRQPDRARAFLGRPAEDNSGGHHAVGLCRVLRVLPEGAADLEPPCRLQLHCRWSFLHLSQMGLGKDFRPMDISRLRA